jgi:hypothetical protein
MFRKRNILIFALCIAIIISITPGAGAVTPISQVLIAVGDANLDGTVNSDDALFILKYLKGEAALLSDIHKTRADANNDRIITISDAIAILEGNIAATLLKPIKVGDVNLDGLVTAADASLLLQYCNGSVGIGEIALPPADFNNDGVINVNDVYALLDYLAASRLN